MKRFASHLLILTLLVACASEKMDKKIDDAAWDSLADETFLRWGEKRLTTVKDQNTVANCYLGKSKETLAKYKKDYETKKDTPYYWLHIGNCYFSQNNWNKAEFFYRLTLEESKVPTVKGIALNNLGLIHFRYEQWEKGKEFLKQSMAAAPKFKVPRFNLAQLYLQFGLYEKAITLLEDPAFRSQKDVDIYFSLANAYLFKGDLKRAESYFKLIPAEHFRREDIAATYALFLIKLGDLKGAKQIMEDRKRSDIPEITAVSQKIEKILAQKLKGK